MASSHPTIIDILRQAQAACVEHDGRLAEARNLLPLWKRLWTNFSAYVAIRDHVVSHRDGADYRPRNEAAQTLINDLVAARLLTRAGQRYRTASHLAARRLRGSWLEELGALVALDAGADEVRFSQVLEWRPHLGDEVYRNEIDVIARFDDRLAFVSCKALTPWAATDPSGDDRVFEALKEVSYWRDHFGHGRGWAILLTTVDFIDEQRHRLRNGGLVERAEVLGVDLVSADAGDYTGLVQAFRKAIDGKPALALP